MRQSRRLIHLDPLPESLKASSKEPKTLQQSNKLLFVVPPLLTLHFRINGKPAARPKPKPKKVEQLEEDVVEVVESVLFATIVVAEKTDSIMSVGFRMRQRTCSLLTKRMLLLVQQKTLFVELHLTATSPLNTHIC